MSEIMPFEYDGQPVRTVEIDGESWFVAADVCKILGIANGPQAVGQLDEDEKQQVSLTISVGYGKTDRDIWVVSEAGLYALILRSDRPEAKPFKRWVTHDLLPTVRKTGRYVMERMSPRQLAELVIKEADRADKAESKVAELEPLAAIADAIAQTAESQDWNLSVGEAAKLLSGDPGIEIGRDRLFQKYFEWKWAFRSPGDKRWQPMQTQVTNGRLTIKVHPPRWSPRLDALVDLTPQVRVKWKGLVETHRRLGGQIPLQGLIDQQEEGQQQLWEDEG